MAGVTQIGNVQGYYMQDGETAAPWPASSYYRGIDITDIIDGPPAGEDRFGYEEVAYLLLLGHACPHGTSWTASTEHPVPLPGTCPPRLHRGHDHEGAQQATS